MSHRRACRWILDAREYISISTYIFIFILSSLLIGYVGPSIELLYIFIIFIAIGRITRLPMTMTAHGFLFLFDLIVMPVNLNYFIHLYTAIF